MLKEAAEVCAPVCVLVFNLIRNDIHPSHSKSAKRANAHFAAHTHFSGDSNSKESASRAGDLDLIRGGRFPGEGNDNLLQSVFLLENSTADEPGGPWGLKELSTTEKLTTLSPSSHSTLFG